MTRLVPLAIAVLCLVGLFLGLDRIGFVDQGEARDAEVARELLERKELLTPALGGEALFDKPLLGYGVDAAGAFLTPDSPLGGRLLRGALAVALVLLTASIGARHFGPRAGACAAAVLASSLALPLAVRTDATQLLATLLAWAGVGGLADALFGRSAGRESRLVVGYGAVATAFLCGGPLPALWPLGGIALYLGLTRRPRGWRALGLGAGLSIVLGLALPWYGAMVERYGLAFTAHVFFFPYAAAARDSWWAGPARAMAFLVVGCFPWSALVPGAALHAATLWRMPRRGILAPPATRTGSAADPGSRELREESAAHCFIACLAASLAPLLLYPVPPLAAALSAAPAAALLCGRLLDHLIEDPRRVFRPVVSAERMMALLGATGALLLALVASRLGRAAPSLAHLAAVLLVLSLAPLLAGFLGRHRLAAGLMALPVGLGTPFVSLAVLPQVEDFLNARSVAHAMDAAAPRRAALVVIGPPPPSLRLYAPRNLVPVDAADRAREDGALALRTAIRQFRASDHLTYVAFRPQSEPLLVRAARGPLEIVLRAPSLVLARVHPE